MHVHLPNYPKHALHKSPTHHISSTLLPSSCLVRWPDTRLRPVSKALRGTDFKNSGVRALSLAPWMRHHMASTFSHRRPPASSHVMHPSTFICSRAYAKRRAAPVCKRHRLGICCGHACTTASKLLISRCFSVCRTKAATPVQ